MTPGPIQGEPRRRPRRLGRALVGLSALVVALAVFAWQQGGDSGGAGPLNAIARAAEKTQNQPGARAAMRGIISSSAQPTFTMRGQMVFNSEGRTRALIMVPRTDGHDSMKLEGVSDGTVMYLRSSRFGSLPDGAKWMALDLSLGEELETPAPANVDAKRELALLEAAGDVKKIGHEDVHGVSTTHYRGTVGVSEQVERLREEGADGLASVVAKEGSPFHVEAWVDAKGLVRRAWLVHSQPLEKGKGSMTIDMRMDFSDFGIDPEIDVPDSSEVFDATAIARREAGLSKP